MARRTRPPPNPFGTSLLDMMTCALGAAILVFVLKESATKGGVALAEEQTRYYQSLAGVNSNHLVRSKNWVGEKTAEVKRRAQGSLFGLPLLKGDVCLVIDNSHSMDWFRMERIVDSGRRSDAIAEDIPARSLKMARARIIVESIVRNSAGIENVSVIVFSGSISTVVDWTNVASEDKSQRADTVNQVLAEVRTHLRITGPSTDLIGAMSTALRKVGSRRHGGAVVLISDGEHSTQELQRPTVAATLDAIRQATKGNISERGDVSVHCIGLFDRVGDGPLPRSFKTEAAQYAPGAERLGKVLSALALSYGGVFIGLPVTVAEEK